jgi:serine/threonine-protein kinase
MNAWALAKSRPLGDILVEQGGMDADGRALVEALVKKSLQCHEGDAAKSLMALQDVGSVHEQLGQIADPDLNASLALVSTVPKCDDPNATSAFTVGPLTSIGLRFRVLRFHAKGGLGQVSLALDTELNREVALKEIQETFADAPEYRARFVREAEVTGGLEHPGIVPVYGLGHYADGRPFYAMRFIKGDNLRNAIDWYHRSTFRDEGKRFLELRKLLGRFLDVCNAIAYAHSRGVLHRDLKPGNIMLGAYGETLVVDWGLAKSVNEADSQATAPEQPLRPSASDATPPTEMGRRLGTPAYMSPEQARGQWDRVGTASDVYSLGATLYNLLTGQAPFSGSTEAIMSKLERGEFAPPRRLNPNVPPPLEAICLKAMARRPEDRYPSARALADDVEQWLADEPVTAHPESPVSRFARWGRRHRPLVAGAVALLVTAVVALAIGIAAVSREKQLTELAREDAVQERDSAEKARKRTREALNEMSSQVIEDWLTRRTQLEPAQKAFLENALARYSAFADESGNTEEVRRSVADAHLRIGNIRKRLNQLPEAEASFAKARDLFAQLAADFPDQPDYRRELAASLSNLGVVHQVLGQPGPAEADAKEAIKLLNALAASDTASPAIRWQLAGSHNILGNLLANTGRPQEAATVYKDSLAVLKELVESHPKSPEYRQELAHIYNNLGLLLTGMGQLSEAEKNYKAALEAQKPLASADPANAAFRRELAAIDINLGMLLAAGHRASDAEAAYREALGLLKQVVADYPSFPEYRQDLGHCQNNLALLLASANRTEPAEAMYREALATQTRMVEDFPSVPDYHNDLANTLDNLADVVRGRKDFAKARELLEQAWPHIQKAMDAYPRNPVYREVRHENRQYLAATLLELGDYALASQAAADLTRLPFDPANDPYQAACLLARCAALAQKDAKLPDAKRAELSKKYADDAMAALRQAVASGFKDLSEMQKKSDLAVLRLRDDFKKLTADPGSSSK